MEVPEDVRIGLANIRQTLRARWNPLAKVTEEWSFDANGEARHKKHEGRWELWDTDESGRDYKITMLEKDGQYVPLGMWVVALVQQINPANYDGDMHRMIEALVDKPNHDIERLGQQQFEELTDYLADLQWHVNTPKSRVGSFKRSDILIPQPVVK